MDGDLVYALGGGGDLICVDAAGGKERWRKNLPRDLEPTHINRNDGTLEGMRHRRWPLFSVQYHPEASAGPHDSCYLFEEFQNLMG